MRTVRIILLLGSCLTGLGAPFAALAQEGTGTIRGVVRDSLRNPIPAAGIVVTPIDRRVYADSAGEFVVAGLPAGAYRVRVRRAGFVPTEIRVALREGETIRVEAVLIAAPRSLDSVIVRAVRECPRFTYAGLLCRQAEHRGLVLTEEDIEARQPIYMADVFKDIPGFRVEVCKDRNGLLSRCPISTTGWRCLVQIVNGMEVTRATAIPPPAEALAIEVYQPKEVPPEYRHFVWPVNRSRRATARPSGQCTLINYWTQDVRRR